MNGSVLYVAYPLLPVNEESCGGAEQMLTLTERGMHDRGWFTCLAAADGSRAAGTLIPTGAPADRPDRLHDREHKQNERVLSWLRNSITPFDLVHDKSGNFWKRAGGLELPVLATLHLPRDFYGEGAFEHVPENVFFNCVSKTQAGSFRDIPGMTGVVQNGVDLQRFRLSLNKGEYLLWLGRICEEKGTDIALDVAERAGMPIIIAGQVYPFRYHQEYFEREVVPRLARRNGKARLLDRLGVADKVWLLRNARALLLPTLAEETSSLVSMEAMACGTPVLAFRRGAVPEVVQHGVGGLIVDSTDEMVDALHWVKDIDPVAARRRIEQCYSASRMIDDYELLYAQVIRSWRGDAALAA